MLNERQKSEVNARLKRISGQIGGIQRMIDEDRYCIDVMTQVSAVVAALRTVEELVLENHLNTCVADAIRSEDEPEQRAKVDEVMEVVRKLRRRG